MAPTALRNNLWVLPCSPGQAYGHRAESGANDHLVASWPEQRLAVARQSPEREASTSCHKVSKSLQRVHAEAGLGMSGNLPRAHREEGNPTWPVLTSRPLLLLDHLPKGSSLLRPC